MELYYGFTQLTIQLMNTLFVRISNMMSLCGLYIDIVIHIVTSAMELYYGFTQLTIQLMNTLFVRISNMMSLCGLYIYI